MQPALQTSNGTTLLVSGSKNLDWNKVDIQVHLTGSHLVEMFRALSQSMLPVGGAFDLNRPEDIPEAVKFHGNQADHYREAGDIDAYFRHAQMCALLKKVEFPLFEEQCVANAMKKWFDAEAACRDMNEKFADILAHPHSTKHVELKCLVSDLRKELTTLLGEKPPSLEALADSFGFGPGADATHTRREGHAVFKMLGHSILEGQDPEVLDSLCPLLAAYGGHPLSAISIGVQAVGYSYESARLEFVPKTCVEHRTIEIMPSLATFVAKGYDHFIRRQLLQVWNIDLQDQMPNRHLAFLGSLEDGDDSPVTLDLSSASDRISMGLIRLILPIEWSRALFPLRSRDVTLPDGTSRILEKFASMGNSITFSLQTAIYGAIIVRAYRAAGLRWKKWRAYGDDLIVVKAAAPRVVADLELVGFKLNMEKSFFSGPFRESCGHDYFRGQYVRPFYIKKPIRTVRDVFKYINTMQTAAVKAPIPAFSYRGLLSYLLGLVPKQFRFLGTPSYGLETCIWSPIVAAPEKIILEREVFMRVPESLALRVTLLNGAGDSEVRIRKQPKKGVFLSKDQDVFTPSQLLRFKRQRRLEMSLAENESKPVRDSREIPTGIYTYLVRRPGRPGVSPLTDSETRKLLVPFWF